MKHKYRVSITLALFLIINLLLVSAAAEITTKVSVMTTGEIAVGQKLKLTYTLENADELEEAKVAWKSSDTEILAINENMMIGKAIGTAQLVCTATFRNGMVFADKVNVEVYTPVKGVSLVEKELLLNVGETSSVHILAIVPAEAKYQAVVWSSSDETIATVDDTGTVRAIKAGRVAIRAMATDPAAEKVKAAICDVTVFQPTETIAFSQSSMDIPKGGKLILTPVFVPEDASDKSLAWISTNDEIVKVNADGTAFGKDVGTAMVMIRDKQGHETAVTMDVYLPVKKILISESKLTLNVGDSQMITAMIEPIEAKYQTVEWVSLDESIATIDQSGTVTAIKAGETKILAMPADPAGKEIQAATCSVSVFQPTESIAFPQDVLMVGKGKKIDIVPIFMPEDASDKNLVWSTSDSSILTVNAKGVISGVALGTATLSIVDSYNHIASCMVNVYIPVSAVTLSDKTMVLKVGETADALIANIKPAEAEYQTVTWQSSDEDVATVNAMGEVTALKAGVASISATADDPSSTNIKVPVCNVTVVQPVTGLSLAEKSIRLPKGKKYQLEPVFEPENASIRAMIWKSSDESVATVNERGIITGKDNGTATLTGETTDGTGVKCSVEIEVYRPVSRITAKSATVAVTMSRTRYLRVSVSPKDASNRTLSWTSSNPSVATVLSSGTVKGISTGSCTITASATDGSDETFTFKLFVEPKIPVNTPTIWRSGYFGFYNRLSIDVENQNATRTIKSISFTVRVDSSSYDCTASVRIAPGKTKRTKSWGLGGLTFANSIKIYLNSVEYTDGTIDSYWGDATLLGSFL